MRFRHAVLGLIASATIAMVGALRAGGAPDNGVPAIGPPAEFDLSWYTIDGGGVMRSTGGNFELSGTIGQPDAGRMSGGTFEMTGGFWFAVVPSDCNADGVVNAVDHGSFEDCLNGPAGVLGTGCACFDFDNDNKITLEDFATLQDMFNAN